MQPAGSVADLDKPQGPQPLAMQPAGPITDLANIPRPLPLHPQDELPGDNDSGVPYWQRGA